MVIFTSTAVTIAVAGICAMLILFGIKLISVDIRDTVTGEVKAVELAKYEVIQDIIDDPTLSGPEKEKLLKALRDEDEIEDILHKVLLIASVVVVAYFAAMYMKGK